MLKDLQKRIFRKYDCMSALTWYKIDNGDKELIETKLSNYLKT